MTLPDSWKEVQLGDLVESLHYGFTASADFTVSGPRLLRITDIEDGAIDWSRVPGCSLDREQLEKYRLRRDDIVFARTGSIEKAARIVNPPVAVFASYLIRGRPLIPELAAWLGLFVGSYSYVGQAKRMSAGVGRANVNAKNLARIRLPLPPRAEQARIVDTVDSYLSRLDAAVSSLDAAQLKLKAYRASILKAAVEGRLVPREAELARREGRSYESAEVLLKRILTERRRRWEDAELARLTAAGKTPNDDRWKKRYPEPDQSDIGSLQSLPEGWCWATVDQVGNVLLGRQRAPQFLTGKWSRPYLRVANIKDDRIDFGDVEEMDFGPEHFEKYCLQAGDILVSEGQSPHLVGQSATYRGELEGLCFQKTLHRFRPFSPGPTSEFAQTVFRAHVSLGVFKAVASITTNIAHLTLEKFKRSRFPLPPATEQERIVEEVARQMSVADAAERQIVADRRRLQRLRQSVLAWAFAGRLVDQSPTDEPAATLLAAIRAAREATPIATPTARRPRKPKAAS